MTEGSDDYHQLLDQKRFLGEIEQGIRFANREIIHKLIKPLRKDDILAFSVAVGRLRGRYLQAAMNLGAGEHGDAPDQSEIKEIRSRREAFEEARDAFDALRDAIEKGYVIVDGIGGSTKS